VADYAKELNQKFGTVPLTGDIMRLYSMLASSPQFQEAMSQNALAGQALSSNLNASLGARGLSTSGIGSVASALGSSASSFGAGALRGGLFGTAGSLASENLLARLQAFANLKTAKANQPSFLQSLTGSILGAGGQVLAGPAGAKIFG
jgi:hypothetical protein